MENLRGAAIMVLAMLAFSVEDALIKLLAGSIPTGQIIAVLGLGGSCLFATICLRQGVALFPREAFRGAILIRNLSELFGTMTFVTALTLIPLATASAILQFAPLLVTLGAAVLYKEPVGWRRWSAITLGFVGVLIVIRPGMDGFDINVIFAVLGTLGLTARDLSTRSAPAKISSMQLSFLAFTMLMPAGLLLTVINQTGLVAPTPTEWTLLATAVLIGGVAYYGITGAMRIGDISFVTSFRYSRILFALIIGAAFFGERPDLATYIGATIIVVSGIYTLWREQKVKSAAK